MYFIDFNEMDENTRKDLIRLLRNYYCGLIYDDESLQEYVENIKNEESGVKKSLVKKRNDFIK